MRNNARGRGVRTFNSFDIEVEVQLAEHSNNYIYRIITSIPYQEEALSDLDILNEG